MKEKRVWVQFDDEEEIQEVQSLEQQPNAGSSAVGDGMVMSNGLKAKVERLTQAMFFFVLLSVALAAC